MKDIVNLLFEANILKEIPRSGYHFLGAGQESVAEHTFSTAMIAFVMSKIEPDLDALKLISMCLVHDLPEARIGDLNTVHKQYVTADESRAIPPPTRRERPSRCRPSPDEADVPGAMICVPADHRTRRAAKLRSAHR